MLLLITVFSLPLTIPLAHNQTIALPLLCRTSALHQLCGAQNLLHSSNSAGASSPPCVLGLPLHVYNRPSKHHLALEAKTFHTQNSTTLKKTPASLHRPEYERLVSWEPLCPGLPQHVLKRRQYTGTCYATLSGNKQDRIYQTLSAFWPVTCASQRQAAPDKQVTSIPEPLSRESPLPGALCSVRQRRRGWGEGRS